MGQMYVSCKYKTSAGEKKFAKLTYTLLPLREMERQLTALAAWADFWRWVKARPEWKDIPRKEKQYMYRAKKDAKDGRLGYERIKNILSKYAPARYRFEERVILIEP